MLYESLLCCHRELGSLQQYQLAQQGFETNQRGVGTDTCPASSNSSFHSVTHNQKVPRQTCCFQPVRSFDQSIGSIRLQSLTEQDRINSRPITFSYHVRCQVPGESVSIRDLNSLPSNQKKNETDIRSSNVEFRVRNICLTDDSGTSSGECLRTGQKHSTASTDLQSELSRRINNNNLQVLQLHGSPCWRDPRHQFDQQDLAPRFVCGRGIVIDSSPRHPPIYLGESSNKLPSCSCVLSEGAKSNCGRPREGERLLLRNSDSGSSHHGKEVVATTAAATAVEQKRIAVVRSCCRSISPMPKRAGTAAASGTSAKASSNKLHSSTSSNSSTSHNKKIKTEHKSGTHTNFPPCSYYVAASPPFKMWLSIHHGFAINFTFYCPEIKSNSYLFSTEVLNSYCGLSSFMGETSLKK